MSGDVERLRRWMRRAHPSRGELSRALVAGFVAGVTNVALLVGAIALLVESATRPGLRAVAVVLVVIELFAFLRSPLRFAERLSAHRLGYAAVTHWRSWLVQVVGRFDYARWRRYASGDLLERALTDTDQLQDLWLRFVIPAIDTVAVLVLGDVVVAVLPPHGHWWTFVLVLVLSQVLGALALVRLATVELGEDRALRAARGNYRAQLVELSAAVPALVLLARSSLAHERLERAAHRLAHAESARRRRRRGSSAVVVVASLVALAGVAQHPRTSNVWLAVAAMIGLATFDALSALRAALGAAVEVSGGGERLDALATTDQPRTETWPVGSPIRLNHLALVEDEQRLLTDASLVVEPGSRLAIVGESGVGKSTLLRSIAGLDAPHEGEVLVGEVVISALIESDLRDHLAYVASEPGLTRGYALDVVTLARTGARDALSDLAALGLEAERSTRFEALSRGEDARVAIARALFVAPEVVVLDEPTAGLGHDETRRVLDLLEASSATVIVATHDDQVVAWCDVVVELRGGELRVLRR